MVSTSPAAHLKLVDSQRDEEDRAEFRQRMKMNCVAAVVIVALLSIGIWLANAMVETQKVQGCYASGARSCSLI
jgi:hypothetical protein